MTERRRSEGRQAAIAELGRRALEGTELAELTQYAVELVASALGVEYGVVSELLPRVGSSSCTR